MPGNPAEWVLRKLGDTIADLESRVAAFQARVAKGDIAWAIDSDGEAAIAAQRSLESLRPLRDTAAREDSPPTPTGLQFLFEDASAILLGKLLKAPWREVSSSPVGLMKAVGTANGIAHAHAVCEQVVNHLRSRRMAAGCPPGI